MSQLSDRYKPQDVESKTYKWWEENSYFEAEDTSTKPPFCIILPPPNVTGFLHMGHALDHTLQDVLIRWKRMSGFNTLWLPGTDHAGIATQSVVEKDLAKQGIKRVDVVCPGFAADCLETLDEIENEYEEVFLEHGTATPRIKLYV